MSDPGAVGARPPFTGSGRNIGRSIALALAGAGAAVVVNARSSAAEAEAVAEEIRRAGGRSAVKVADVSDPKAVDALVDDAVRAFGRLDILVNNAAVRKETDFANLHYAEWREIISTILDSAYLCSHAALPHLTASGSGAIVNIGGLSSFTGAAGRAHVIAAKAGLVALRAPSRMNLARYGHPVNCGLRDCSYTAVPRGRSGHHALHAPLVGRRGRPEEIAALVRFLSGPDARYITGQTIHANGGLFMS